MSKHNWEKRDGKWISVSPPVYHHKLDKTNFEISRKAIFLLLARFMASVLSCIVLDYLEVDELLLIDRDHVHFIDFRNFNLPFFIWGSNFLVQFQNDPNKKLWHIKTFGDQNCANFFVRYLKNSLSKEQPIKNSKKGDLTVTIYGTLDFQNISDQIFFILSRFGVSFCPRYVNAKTKRIILALNERDIFDQFPNIEMCLYHYKH